MTTAEFIEATEHIEGAEGDYEKVSREPTSLPRRNFRREGASGTKYCKLHGTNATHDTKDCKVLKARDSGGYNKERFLQVTRLGRVTAQSQLRNPRRISTAVNKAVKQQLKSLDTGKKRDLNALKNEDGEPTTTSLSNFDYSTIEYGSRQRQWLQQGLRHR
jgi:hypothetical protein